MVTDETHRVSGVLTPDSTGDYRPAGTYDGRTYYSRTDNTWFIWWDTGTSNWIISTVLGVYGANYWRRADPDILGVYVVMGGAVGVATVTEI